MRRVLLALICALLWPQAASAGLTVRVNLTSQRMQVATPDGATHHWAISSGRLGYRTPNGTYRPQRLERSWVSRKYGGAMPYAVFFRGGYAIHGTSAIGRLGAPASHGCIRLHPSHAAMLFHLVRRHGMGDTRIVITGSAYGGERAAPDRIAAPRTPRTVRVAARPAPVAQPRRAVRTQSHAATPRARTARIERPRLREYVVYTAIWQPGIGYVYQPSHTVMRPY